MVDDSKIYYKHHYWEPPIWLYLFLGGLGTGFAPLNALILAVLCVVLTVLCMTTIHAVTARLKIEHLFKFYWTIVVGLAALSLVLVWFGL